MTEKEAKTKWCPHARFADCGADNASTVNRDGMWGEGVDRCIASDCMMWVIETSVNCSSGVRSVCGGHCGLAK